MSLIILEITLKEHFSKNENKKPKLLTAWKFNEVPVKKERNIGNAQYGDLYLLIYITGVVIWGFGVVQY